jgi:hypothetical protein
MNATAPIDYAQIESVVLGLPEESRCRLTHVLIRSIEQGASFDSARESRWLDFADRVNEAIDDGRMATVDAFEALAKMRQNLANRP